MRRDNQFFSYERGKSLITYDILNGKIYTGRSHIHRSVDKMLMIQSSSDNAHMSLRGFSSMTRRKYKYTYINTDENFDTITASDPDHFHGTGKQMTDFLVLNHVMSDRSKNKPSCFKITQTRYNVKSRQIILLTNTCGRFTWLSQ